MQTPQQQQQTALSLKANFNAMVDRYFKPGADSTWADGCKKAYGLEQPMWVWTHRAGMSTLNGGGVGGGLPTTAAAPDAHKEDLVASLEVTRIENLVHWLVTICHVDGADIGVVCTSNQKKKLVKSLGTVVANTATAAAMATNAAAARTAPTSFGAAAAQHLHNATANKSLQQQQQAAKKAAEQSHYKHSKSRVALYDHQELIGAMSASAAATTTATTTTVSVVSEGTAAATTTAPAAPPAAAPNGAPTAPKKPFAVVIYAFGVPMAPTYFPFMDAVAPSALQHASSGSFFVGGGGVASASALTSNANANTNTNATTATTANSAATSGAFIMLCDAAWCYAPAVRLKCPLWSSLLSDVLYKPLPKIRMPIDFAKTLLTPSIASTSGIIAGQLPICCPAHPQQRHLADGNSVFEGFCNAKCLKHFHCKENDAKIAEFIAANPNTNNMSPASLATAKLLHRCQSRCHLATEGSVHACCPFICTSKIHPCGEECQTGCSDDHCTCAHDVEVPLDCYHEIVVGFDGEETFQPITERVFHVFRGACNDVEKARRHCTVNVPTICSVCSGDFVAPCHALTALNHQLADGQRTAVCDGCTRRQRQIRSEVRRELIREIDTKRSKAQQDLKMKQYLNKIGKGASAAQQTFDIGQRVVISDMEYRRQPYEFDYPDCHFVYFGDEEQYFAKVSGAHGVIIQSVVEGSEQQYILLLSSGEHVLFASNGLKVVKAIGNFEMTGASMTMTYLITVGAEKASNMLMLEQRKQQQNEEVVGVTSPMPPAAAANDDDTAAPAASLSTAAAAPQQRLENPFSALVRPHFGKYAIVIKPIAVRPPKEFMTMGGGAGESADEHHDSYTMSDDDGLPKEILMSNVVGTIVGDDVEGTLKTGQPMVKFRVTFTFVDESSSSAAGGASSGVEDIDDDDGAPDAKRGRAETADGTSASANNNNSNTANENRRRPEKTITMIVSAAFPHLEIISLREAKITQTDKQLLGGYDDERDEENETSALFTGAAGNAYATFHNKKRATTPTPTSSGSNGNICPPIVIRDTLASRDEMFTVVGIVNYPIVRKGLEPFNVRYDVDLEAEGLFTTKAPCVVLESRVASNSKKNASSSSSSALSHLSPAEAKIQQQLDQMKAGLSIQHPQLQQFYQQRTAQLLAQLEQLRNGGGGTTSNGSANTNKNKNRNVPEGAVPLVIAPLLFVDVDEEAAAERQLEAAEFAKLELLYDERYKKACDDLFFANEEKRVLEEQQMPALKKIAAAAAVVTVAADGGGGEETDNANAAAPVNDSTFVVTADVLESNKMTPIARSETVAMNSYATQKQQQSSTTAAAAVATPMLIFDQKSAASKGPSAVDGLGGTPQRLAAASAMVGSSPLLAPSMGASLSSAVGGGTPRGSSLPFGSLDAPSAAADGTSSAPIIGHVKAHLLTPQQKANGVWGYCYSLPSKVITSEEAFTLKTRRSNTAMFPKTPTAVLLEIEKKRQHLASVQPSAKVIEEWGHRLNNAAAEDQKADQMYGMAVNRLVEEECARRGIPLGGAGVRR